MGQNIIERGEGAGQWANIERNKRKKLYNGYKYGLNQSNQSNQFRAGGRWEGWGRGPTCCCSSFIFLIWFNNLLHVLQKKILILKQNEKKKLGKI